MPNSMEDISNIPSKNQTLELCEEAVKKEATNIRYVAKRFLSSELCLQAVEADLEAILFIKKEFLSKEILLMFFTQIKNKDSWKRMELMKKFEQRINKLKGFEIGNVVDEELAMELARINGVSVNILSHHLRTKDVILTALDTYGYAISYIPEDQRTKEVVLKAIKGGAGPKAIDDAFLQDDEILDAIITENPVEFYYLEKEKKTYERCLLAVQHGMGFRSVPVEHYSQEMFDALVAKDTVKIEQIPTKFLNKDLVKRLITSSALRQRLDGLSPHDMDEELAYLAICNGYSLKDDCIREHQSERVVKEAINRSWTEVEYVKPEFLTKELAEGMIKEIPEAIKCFPKEFLTEELCYFAVSNGVPVTYFDISFQSQRIIDELLKKRELEALPLKKEGINQSLVKILNEESEKAFDVIRPDFKTQAFYIEAFKQNCNLLTHVSIDILTDDILVPLIQHNWEYIQYIPKERQTANVAMAALEQNPEAINHFEL